MFEFLMWKWPAFPIANTIAKTLVWLWNKVWFDFANFLNFVLNYLSDYRSSRYRWCNTIVSNLALQRLYRTFLFSICVCFACAFTINFAYRSPFICCLLFVFATQFLFFRALKIFIALSGYAFCALFRLFMTLIL